MKQNPQWTVAEQDSLLPFLRKSLAPKSRNYVKGVLARGQVQVDGVTETNYARGLHPGQIVSVLTRKAEDRAACPLPILYEDDELLIIDKPCGMLSIATEREREETAYHIVTAYLKARDPVARVFVVHRLDRETSGVMLFSKSESLKHALQEQWEQMAKRRAYIALVEGRVTPPEGRVVSWLRQTRTLLVYSSSHPGDGKKAITNYKTLACGGGYSLLELTLETGRKNQIRVHMKDLGHPVAGDKKYGARTNPLGRLCLHASCLELEHPTSGEQLRFEAPVPPAFLSKCAPVRK